MAKLIVFILISFILVSCGEKKASNSVVKLKIIQGNIFNTNSLNGGVLVMGKSENKEHSFRMGFRNASEVLSLSLPKGRWEFAAVSWEGDNGPLTGINRCAYTGIMDLSEAEATVSFNLSAGRCLSDFNGRRFAHHDYLNGNGKFLDFYPVACLDNVIGSITCNSSTNLSMFLSYKVVFEGSKEGQVTGGELPALSSDCLLMNQSPRANIPITESGNDHPFHVKTVFFTTNTCSGTAVAFNFNEGLLNNNLGVWNEVVSNFSQYAFLYLNPGPQFDLSPVNPVAVALDALVDGGYNYVNTTVVSYTLPSIPAKVKDMCLTPFASCSEGEWIPVALNGSANLSSATEGIHGLKLFFRTETGVVSSTPLYENVKLDNTQPMQPSIGTFTSSASGGVFVSWNSGDNSLFNGWLVQVCSDNVCSGVLGQEALMTFSPMSKNFSTGSITGGITIGQNICIRVKAYDKFGRWMMSPIQCTTSGS